MLSTVVDLGGGAAKLGVNVTTGAISLGGKVIGKAVSVGGNVLCNYVAEGWMKLGCGPVKSLLSKLAGKAVGAGGAAASGTTGGGGSSATPTAQVPADSPQSYLRTSAIAAGAAFFSGEIAHVVSRGTSADLTTWYKAIYGRVAGFAVGVALLALLLALAEGATLGYGALVAAALRAVPYAAIMTAAATSLVMSALRVVDAASSDIAGPNMREVTHVLHMAAALFVGLGLVAKASTVAAAHGGALAHLGMIAKLAAFPAAMFASFGVIATAAVAAELVLREVAIYASVLFLPLILAARIWPRLRHAGERLGQGAGGGDHVEAGAGRGAGDARGRDSPRRAESWLWGSPGCSRWHWRRRCSTACSCSPSTGSRGGRCPFRRRCPRRTGWPRWSAGTPLA